MTPNEFGVPIPDAPLSQGEEITPCDTQFTKRWGWWCSAHNKPAWKAHDGNYYCQNMGAEMAQTINLVGDRWDTVAGKIIADAELDEMRGSVIANLCDEIASALRNVHADGCEKIADGVASLIAERDKLKEACDGYLAHAANLRGENAKLEEEAERACDIIKGYHADMFKLVERVSVLERALESIALRDSLVGELQEPQAARIARAALRTSEDAK
jgi:hypothetical protein